MGHTLVGCSFINKPLSSSSLPLIGINTNPHSRAAVGHGAGGPRLSVTVNPSQDSLLMPESIHAFTTFPEPKQPARNTSGMSLNLVLAIISVERDKRTLLTLGPVTSAHLCPLLLIFLHVGFAVIQFFCERPFFLLGLLVFLLQVWQLCFRFLVLWRAQTVLNVLLRRRLIPGWLHLAERRGSCS